MQDFLMSKNENNYKMICKFINKFQKEYENTVEYRLDVN